jgi:hypothetical protein
VTALSTEDDSLDRCFGPDGMLETDEHGSLPTCTIADDGTVSMDYPAPPGQGASAALGLLLVLGLGLAVAGAAWRASMARSMARRSGMDEGSAASMAMFTDQGLEATYLASSLRQSATTPAAAPVDTAARLRELRSLLDQGLITQAEHDERRAQVIAGI